MFLVSVEARSYEKRGWDVRLLIMELYFLGRTEFDIIVGESFSLFYNNPFILDFQSPVFD